MRDIGGQGAIKPTGRSRGRNDAMIVADSGACGKRQRAVLREDPRDFTSHPACPLIEMNRLCY
jgi:hypothetical protein